MKTAISMTIVAGLLCGVSFTAAQAADAPKVKQAAIHFADNGGIYDYKAVNDHMLYIQSRDRTWYRAELFGPCSGLQFATGIGFEPEPGGDFTKYGSVVVGGLKCKVQSLTQIEGAPPKKEAN